MLFYLVYYSTTPRLSLSSQLCKEITQRHAPYYPYGKFVWEKSLQIFAATHARFA
jgi:hypothetical protein